ncbi:MAG: hypothetical protein V4508_01825 [Pseudomonadota bacterium]
MDSTSDWSQSLRRTLLFLTLCTFAFGNALAAQHADLPVDAYLSPTRPMLEFGKQSTSATLRLINLGLQPIALRVECVHLMLKGGGATGHMHFQKTESSIFPEIQLGVGAGSTTSKSNGIDIVVEFGTLLNTGIYEAAFDIVSLTAPGLRKRVEVEVLRPAAGIPPSVRAVRMVNGTLAIKPQSADDDTFTLFVENPVNGSESKFEIELLQPAGKAGKMMVAATPSSFILAPGAAKAVEFSIANLKESGSYTGAILINGASGAQRDLPLIIEPNYINGLTVTKLILFVAIGTAFSIAVGTVIPTMVARRKAWQTLDELQSQIDHDLTRASAVQVALTAERRRIEFLIAQIGWYSPQANAELLEIVRQTAALKADVDFVSQVTYERDLVRRVEDMPISLAAKFVRTLDEVGDEVVAGNNAAATTNFQIIKTRIHDANLLQSVQETLKLKVSALPVPQPDTSPDVFVPDLIMRARVRALKLKLASLAGPLDPAEVIAIDSEWYAVHLYVDQFIGQVLKRRPKFDFMEATMLEELASGVNGSWRATELLKSLESGVLPADIVNAIITNSLMITVMPPEPREHELAEFRLTFREPRLNDSPLTSRMKFFWRFGDDTSPASGQRCVHFYKKTKPKTLAGMFRNSKGNKSYVVTCMVSYLDEVAETATSNVLVRRGPRTNYRIIGSEITSTAVVFVGAVALSFISHITELHAFEGIHDYFNPILWGFGLDQMKGLVNKNRVNA